MQRLVLYALICALPGLAIAQSPAQSLTPRPADDGATDVILVADGVIDAAEGEPAEAGVDSIAEPELLILDATEVDLDSLLWLNRIVAILADTPNDPAFIEQLRRIEASPDDFIERDAVVILDSDRNSGSDLRRMLRPRGFMLAFIEKDGSVAQRRPSPRSVREINAVIDRFPLRRQEMLERRPSGR